MKELDVVPKDPKELFISRFIAEEKRPDKRELRLKRLRAAMRRRGRQYRAEKAASLRK